MDSGKFTNRHFDSVASLKLGFRRDEAAAAVGSAQLLDDMHRAGWITPVVNRHKLVLFDRGDIQRAWARILAGETPPMRKRKSKNQLSNHNHTPTRVAKPDARHEQSVGSTPATRQNCLTTPNHNPEGE